MRFRRSRSKLATVLVIAVLTGAGWMVFKPSSKTATAPTPASSQTTQPTSTTKGADPAKLVTIGTADFKYSKPVGWAEISPKTLDSTGAASGIGRPTEPVATFSVKVSNAVPKDNNDLKNSTLNELKKFTNFQLVSDVDTKVDGQAGRKFTYNFSDSSGNNKTTQQMSVVPYKQKTFFLLFSSTAADYDKQTGDFSAILSGFKFK
mgnify:CR=1 FL=1